jgi:benzoylformate decarboxylase
MSGRNSFPENHRLFAGFLASDRGKIVASLGGYDCILVLGAPVFTYHVEGFGPHVPPGAKVFQIHDDPAAAAWAAVGVSVFASLRLSISELLSGPVARARDWPPERTRINTEQSSALTDVYLLQRLAALRPAGSIIVEEAPSTRPPMHDYLPITERDTFYTCASGGLGHGLPAAVGVALARPGEKVIALLGDGSAMYAIQALYSAAQLGLPVTFVIVNNQRYEALVQFGRHFGLKQTVGTSLPALDFAGIARAQGCEAVVVEDSAALDEALLASFEARKPTLVEVRVSERLVR